MADLASRFYLLQVDAAEDSAPRIALYCGEQLVGSIPEAAVYVARDDVAPMHANLWVQYDAVYVTDLGSESGSAINGQPLNEGLPTALELGDKVRFGGAAFILRESEE